jgi:hypothetical protein
LPVVDLYTDPREHLYGKSRTFCKSFNTSADEELHTYKYTYNPLNWSLSESSKNYRVGKRQIPTKITKQEAYPFYFPSKLNYDLTPIPNLPSPITANNIIVPWVGRTEIHSPTWQPIYKGTLAKPNISGFYTFHKFNGFY